MENKNIPLISVIIPTYKRSEMIDRAINSVLNQTWKNIEVVVVNDNIPDSEYDVKTKEKMKKYSNDNRVKFISTTGKTGGGAARNFAIRQCNGDYIAFLDDDDRFLEEKLEKQYNFMIENNLDMSYQDVTWNDEKDNLIEYRKLDYVTDFNKDELIRNHILHSLCPTAIYMIKRSELLKTDGFGEVIMGQDWFLMLRCIEADMKIGYMPGSYVVQYLHNSERISLGNNKIKGENFLYDYKKNYFSYLDKKDIKYVKFRHFAVLSFASMRSKMYGSALKNTIKTIGVSPVLCIKEGLTYFKN